MSTKLVDEDGNLLWSPNDFGSYSIEKISALSEILKELLSTVTINMQTKVDESSLVNVYTKNQADTLFAGKSEIDSLVGESVSSEIGKYASSGNIVSGTQLDEVRSKLLEVYSLCCGTDFEGNRRCSSFAELIAKNSNVIDVIDNEVSRLMKVVFKWDQDGYSTETKVYSKDESKAKFAEKELIGSFESLDKEFKDHECTDVVSALNYILSKTNNDGIA